MKNDVNKTIGANIRRLRTKHGETQKQLGELLGYEATTIANYESGYRMPDVEAFIKIALHYDAQISDFISDLRAIDECGLRIVNTEEAGKR